MTHTELIKELKDLITIWMERAKDQYNAKYESLAYIHCAEDINKIIQKHKDKGVIE